MQFYVKQFSSGYELEKFINENKINKENIVKVEYIYKDSIVFDSVYILYYYGQEREKDEI